MKDFFKELFDYSYHFNVELIKIMIDHPLQLSVKCVKLQSHMLNSHQIWNNRISRIEEPFGVWQVHPVSSFLSINKSNYDYSIKLLNTVELNDIRQYSNTKGDKFSNTVRDMFFQIINHTTYHRGQLASEFRAMGLEPLLTEYIFYKR